MENNIDNENNIIYTVLVRHPKTILCEYTEHSGKFLQLTNKILSLLNTKQSQDISVYKAMFSFGNYQFSIMKDRQLYLMCIFNNLINNNDNIFSLIFSFMCKCLFKLKETYSLDVISDCEAYSLDQFVPILKDNINLFNFQKTRIKYFNDFINRGQEIKEENNIHNKKFENNINYSIKSIEETHEDHPNEYDPLEIRASTYQKYKFRQNVKNEDNLFDVRDEESKKPSSKDLESNNSYLDDSLINGSLVSPYDDFLSQLDSMEIRRKKGCCQKWKMRLILLLSILIIVAVLVLIYVFVIK
jgi:hypothetical protein